jgi:transcriptional regulator with XRE-family HTH domain
MSVGSKMKEVMKANGIDQYSMADMLSLKQPTLNQYLNEKRKIPNEVIKKFSNILKISTDTLYDEKSIVTPHPLVPAGLPDSISIKIIDVVACCGNGIEALHENIIGTWDIPLTKFRDFSTAKPENAYMFQVDGDSMTPTINTGDWAIADMSQNYISSDGLYLIRTASGLMVKRIQSGLNNIIIRSDNPAYGEINANVGEIAVLGRVIYILNAQKVG